MNNKPVNAPKMKIHPIGGHINWKRIPTGMRTTHAIASRIGISLFVNSPDKCIVA